MKKNAAADEKKMSSTRENRNSNNSDSVSHEGDNEHDDALIGRRSGDETDFSNDSGSGRNGRNRSGGDGSINSNNNNNNSRGGERRRRPPPSLAASSSNNGNPTNSNSGSSNAMQRQRDNHGEKYVYGRKGGEGEAGGGKVAALSSNASRASRDTVSTASITVGSMGTSAPGSMSIGSGALGYSSGNGRRGARGRRRRNNLRRSRNMYNRQLQLLLSISGSSVILFLFFFLNIFAFTAMMTGFASAIMFVHTLFRYITFVVGQGEGALYDFLPTNLQEYLANTSLHEAMTSSDNIYMENRWYLLYFIPGLTPQQVNAMVSRLPQRHRDMAHGPGGLARMFLPDEWYRYIAPPNDRSTSLSSSPRLESESSEQPRRLTLTTETTTDTVTNTGTEGDNRRYDNGHAHINTHGHIHDPSLPVIIERDEEEDFDDDEEEEVTMQDAFHGLLHNVRELVTGTSAQRRENEQGAIAHGLSEELESDVSYDDNDEHGQVIVHRDISWDDSRGGGRMIRVEDSGDTGMDTDTDADGFVSESQTSRGEDYQYHDLSWETQGSELDIDDDENDHIQGSETVRVELTVDLDDEESDDASDLGLDIEEDDFVGGMNDGQLRRLARLIRLPFRNRQGDAEEEIDESPTSEATEANGHTTGTRSVSQTSTPTPRTPLIPPHRRPLPVTSRDQSHGSNAENSLPSTVMARRLEPMHMPPLSGLPPRVETNHNDEEQTLQTLEEQQEIEGDILNEALSTMIDNYTNTARSAVLDVAQTLVERIAPVAIRLGVRLSSLSTVGLLGFYSSMGRNFSGNIISSVSGRRLTQTGANVHTSRERYIITGLTSSIVLGAFSVGSAYIARSYVRRAAASSRRDSEELQDNIDDHDPRKGKGVTATTSNTT